MDINILVVDDQSFNIDLIKSYLIDLGLNEENVFEAKGIEEALDLYNNNQIDLIFSDIELQDGYGFEIIKKMEGNVDVVFISAHPQYAIKSFDFNPLHYILKPVDKDKIKEALDRFFEHNPDFESKRGQKGISGKVDNIIINERDSIKLVKLEEIIYCEADASYTTLYINSGEKHYISKPIKHYENILDDKMFIRIHDKYIINLLFFDSYIKGRGGNVMLKGDIMLPVSVRKKEVLLSKLRQSSH